MMMMRPRCDSLFLWMFFPWLASAFAPRKTSTCDRYPLTFLASSSSASTVATLTDQTLWRMRLVMTVPTESGKKVDQLFVINGRFLEDSGYEPPQGTFQQEQSPTSMTEGSKTTTLRIRQARWQLSEDPNDRKDGLWVWGLFQEPLYPFLLLKMETEPLELGDSNDRIPALQLYAQLNHRRDRANPSTSGVTLDAAPLTIKEKSETIRADPFGAASVDLYETVNIGTVSFQPIL